MTTPDMFLCGIAATLMIMTAGFIAIIVKYGRRKTSGERCAACRHFEDLRKNSGDEWGKCLRFPPALFPPNREELQIVSGRPPAKATDRCGEWEAQ